MFEILKALRDLNTACTNHGAPMSWRTSQDVALPVLLMVEIQIDEDDERMLKDMQAMFAPREG